MRTASIRDRRTRFPYVRRLLEQEGEIVVTDRGRPVILLRLYEEAPVRRAGSIDYYGRLQRRMPRAITAAQRRKLDEVERGER